jgi:hypothetical protein
VQLFESHIPKTEVWAGAGVLFPELDLVKWNTDFPEGLRARLLIVGSAANGDHIAIDLKDGSTGYISHEHDWPQQPRRYFTAVSQSIGSYLSEINSDPPLLPEDYWAAMKVKESARKVKGKKGQS